MVPTRQPGQVWDNSAALCVSEGKIGPCTVPRRAWRGHHRPGRAWADSAVLGFVSRKRGSRVVQFLVEHGADVTACDRSGLTPLHRAAYSGHVDLAQFLVEHGADTTAQNKDGLTPLHWASSSGKVDLARFLVEHGADVTAQNKNGFTPLHFASGSGKVDLAQFLVEHALMRRPRARTTQLRCIGHQGTEKWISYGFSLSSAPT